MKDANEIIPQSDIFIYRCGSYSAFLNLFRFALLYKKGSLYVDMDVICVRPFHIEDDFVIPMEYECNSKTPKTYWIGFLYARETGTSARNLFYYIWLADMPISIKAIKRPISSLSILGSFFPSQPFPDDFSFRPSNNIVSYKGIKLLV